MDASPAHSDLLEEIKSLRARVAQLEATEAQRGKAETTLRESEQLYRRLVETLPDSTVLADATGKILMANRKAAAVHGYGSPADMVDINVLDLVMPQDRSQAVEDIERILKNGEVRDRQYNLFCLDGSSFIAEVTGALVRDATGEPKYVVYSSRDVTGRIRQQREMVESQKLESIGRLAGGIAHDFNNLLAVILGNASLQLRNRNLPPKTIDCLKDIVEAAERASSLTTQLLAYARGGLRRAIPGDLNQIIEMGCNIIRPILPRQLSLKVELEPNLPQVVVDRTQIQQVVINLCMNAIEASTPPGEVAVRTRSATLPEPRARELQLQPGPYVQIQVQDHGLGIAPDIAERVLEPFFTTKPDSRGMGLSVSLGIVQSHQGRLLISSEPGRGTLATVWLPAAAKDTLDTPSASEGPANAPHGTETILLVEPDLAVSRTAEQILASLGYCAIARNEAESALAFLESNCDDIDMVLLNFNLPTKSGREMLSNIYDTCGDMPVLLTSAADQHAEAEALMPLGAAGFVPKPFSFMSLAQAIRKVLDAPNCRRRPQPPDG